MTAARRSYQRRLDVEQVAPEERAVHQLAEEQPAELEPVLREEALHALQAALVQELGDHRRV